MADVPEPELSRTSIARAKRALLTEMCESQKISTEGTVLQMRIRLLALLFGDSKDTCSKSDNSASSSKQPSSETQESGTDQTTTEVSSTSEASASSPGKNVVHTNSGSDPSKKVDDIDSQGSVSEAKSFTDVEDDIKHIPEISGSSMYDLLEPAVPITDDVTFKVENLILRMSQQTRDQVVLEYLKSSQVDLFKQLLRRAVASNMEVDIEPATLGDGERIPKQSNRKQSWVWKHIYLSGPDTWHCRICTTTGKYHRTTTNLKNHLKVHKISEFSKRTNISRPSGNNGNAAETTMFDAEHQKIFIESLVIWIARDKLPACMVDSPAFKYFISKGSLGKLTSPVSSTIYKHIGQLGKKHDEILKHMLESECSPGFGTAEIDLWEGPDKYHYLGVICHFITSKWEKNNCCGIWVK